MLSYDREPLIVHAYTLRSGSESIEQVDVVYIDCPDIGTISIQVNRDEDTGKPKVVVRNDFWRDCSQIEVHGTYGCDLIPGKE